MKLHQGRLGVGPLPQRYSISKPVGPGQPNIPRDVRVIQSLLNQAVARREPLKIDGLFGPKTQAALDAFQRESAGFKHPDAVADPGKRTMRSLNSSSPPCLPLTAPTTHSRPLALVHMPGPAIPHTRTEHQIIEPASPQHRVLLHASASHVQPKITSWITRVLPAARACKTKWRVPIAVTIAQGAMESHWGTQPIGRNNYYGVKGASAHGSTVSATHEERHGKLVRENDAFRAYLSLEESVDDFGRYLNENHRYHAAFASSNDAEAFFMSIARAGYATKHDYQQLVIKVMRSHGIEDFDHE